MIRPEVAALLRRYQELLAGVAVAALGLYWLVFSGGLLRWIGAAVILAGGALAIAGVQRARFRQGGGGPGVVQVVERRVSYFGPLDGGVLDLDALTSLVLDPSGTPPHWVLRSAGQPPLHIPLTAKGADALFDAFSSLPGLQVDHMLRQVDHTPAGPVVIWRTAAAQDAVTRLH